MLELLELLAWLLLDMAESLIEERLIAELLLVIELLCTLVSAPVQPASKPILIILMNFAKKKDAKKWVVLRCCIGLSRESWRLSLVKSTNKVGLF